MAMFIGGAGFFTPLLVSFWAVTATLTILHQFLVKLHRRSIETDTALSKFWVRVIDERSPARTKLGAGAISRAPKTHAAPALGAGA